MRLRYVYGQDELISRFVAALVPHVDDNGWQHAVSMGVIDEEGKLIAGVVWYNYSRAFGHIEVGAAATSPHWFTRETIRRLYGYPFDELGCQLVLHVTPATDNDRVKRILAGLGCYFVEVPRLFGRARDGVVAGLTEEVWRNSKLGRRLAQVAQQEAA